MPGGLNCPALSAKNTTFMIKATLKKDFLIRNIAGENVLIGCGEQVNFSKMLILNDTATSLVSKLQQKNGATSEELAQHLTEEYNVDYEAALADVEELLKQLEELGVIGISL